MKKIHILYFVSVFMLLMACDDPIDDNTSSELSNFQVSIEVIDEQSGTIGITQSADNAVSYDIDYGDGATVSTGSTYIEYSYQESSIYTVVVKAVNSEGRFLRYEDEVIIDFGDIQNLHEGYTTPLSYDGMELVFSQEFDIPTLDGSIWTYEIGNGCPQICGWGNNEWQYYKSQNTTIENGLLTIQAKNESFEQSNYTSSRIISKGNFAFQYGRVDIRARMPNGQGIWPALWLLGSNISEVSWPSCGEIDIMEMVGNQASTTFGTAHWSHDGSHASHGGSTKNIEDLDQEFHVYSIEWTQQSIKWFFDDNVYHSLNITGLEFTEFHQPYFMIMNIAVGGNWPGYPNPNTEFPTAMDVDYIRVFQ